MAENESQKQSLELDKEEVFYFVKVYVQVEQYRQILQVKGLGKDGKRDPSKEDELNKKFESRTTQILKNEGITADIYSKYMQLLKHSTDFQNLVKAIIDTFPKK